MDAQIVLREIAAAAVDLVGLCHTAGDDLDARIEREAIALGSGQFKAHPVTSGNAVIPQKHRRPVDIADDNVHVAVIEEIADREAARDARLHQRRARLIAGIAEGSVLLIQLQQLRLAIAAPRRAAYRPADRRGR